jgi:hypothetical protein
VEDRKGEIMSKESSFKMEIVITEYKTDYSFGLKVIYQYRFNNIEEAKEKWKECLDYEMATGISKYTIAVVIS